MLLKTGFSCWLTCFALVSTGMLNAQASVESKAKSPTNVGKDDSSRVEELKQALIDFGVEPNHKSISHYLQSLIPDQKTVAETRKWVARLQDESYANRKAASKKLISMPVITIELIEEMLDHTDLEVAYRVERNIQSTVTARKRNSLGNFRIPAGIKSTERHSHSAQSLFAIY